jgi:hypothetical protein
LNICADATYGIAPSTHLSSSLLLQCRLYDGELEAVRCCALEEASLDGSRLLAYLPGCILVNREPLGSGLLPDTSPNRITRSVLAAVYALLQVGGAGAAAAWAAGRTLARG